MMSKNKLWHKWLLAGTIAFIATVAWAYQDEVHTCLIKAPACTVLYKTQDRLHMEETD